MKPSPIEAFVTAQAELLGLPIAAEHRPGVLAYVALAAEMARLVEGLPLGIDDEAANVFIPVGTADGTA